MENAFYETCVYGDLTIVKQIAQHVNVKNQITGELIREIVFKGHDHIIQWLIDNEYLDSETSYEILFDELCSAGKLKLARQIFDKINDQEVIDNAFGGACESNHKDVATWLFEYVDREMIETAFVNSCYEENNQEVIKWLLEYVGEEEISEGIGIACNLQNYALARYLFPKIKLTEKTSLYLIKQLFVNYELMNRPNKSIDLGTVKWLVEEKGLQFHVDKELLLSKACNAGKLEIVKYLIEQGADKNADNEKPFRYASHGGNLEVLKYLYSLGVDVEANYHEAFCVSQKTSLDLSRWFVSINGKYDVYENGRDSFISITENGQTERIYCCNNIHSLNDYYFRQAIKNGHIEIVEWLKDLVE